MVEEYSLHEIAVRMNRQADAELNLLDKVNEGLGKISTRLGSLDKLDNSLGNLSYALEDLNSTIGGLAVYAKNNPESVKAIFTKMRDYRTAKKL